MADYHVIVWMIMALSFGYMMHLTRYNIFYHSDARTQVLIHPRSTPPPTQVIDPTLPNWGSSSSSVSPSLSLSTNDDPQNISTIATPFPASIKQSFSLPPSWLHVLASEYRWSVIPQGWGDDEEYDSDIDDVTCRSYTRNDDRHLRDNKELQQTLARFGLNVTSILTRNTRFNASTPRPKVKPWWYSRIVEGSECQQFTSIKQCHQTSSLTCQWSLQGYCFNFTAPSIGWFQAEAYPGGLTNQEVSALKGLAIARYVQSKLYDYGIIATLLSRLHRQSPTAGVRLEGANNDYKDFRPFRHFFDASSIYCPVDMGPIIETTTIVHHFLPAAQSPFINMNFPNGTSKSVPRPGPLLNLDRHRMGTFRRPFCDQHSAHRETQNRSNELVSYYRDVLLAKSSVPHHGIITRTWWCDMKFISYPIEQQIWFARRWYRIVNSITSAMMRDSSSLTTITTSSPSSLTSVSNQQQPYIGFHLRHEDDICNKSETSVFFCKWTPQQWMKCLNSFLVKDGQANLTIGYIATDRTVIGSKWYEPFRNSSLMGNNYNNIKWYTKSSLIGQTHRGLMKRLRREELAIVDQLMLSKSIVFAGVQRSSFSAQIASNRRGRPGWFSHLLDRFPPHGCRGIEL